MSDRHADVDAPPPPPDPSPALPAQPSPDFRAELRASLGGKRGMFDTGLPAVVFVVVNAAVDAFSSRDAALRAAIAAAVLCGLAVVAVRLLRREPLRQAVSGFFGLAIAAFFAARSGEARGFFLPGIFINLAYGTAFLVSALVGHPLIGHVYATVEDLPATWRQDRRLRRAFAVASCGWALLFAVKAAVQGALYLADRPGWLAAARLLMGWPLYALAAVATIAWVKRARAA